MIHVEVNKENRVFTVGQKTFNSFINIPKSVVLCRPHLCEIAGLPYERVDVDKLKEWNQKFTELTKITPSKAVKLLNSLMFAVFIAPIGRDVIWAYGREGAKVRKLNETSVKRLWDSWEVVKVCLEDNQKHMIPICATFNTTPHELKNSIPKHLWKKLINNSLTRNGLIAQKMPSVHSAMVDVSHENRLSPALCSSSMLKFGLFIYPLNSLQVRRDLNAEERMLVNLTSDRLARENKLLTKESEFKYLRQVIYDTVVAAKKVDEVVNPKWSWKRWQEEHNRITKLEQQLRYSDERFGYTGFMFVPKDFSSYGYTATLLSSERLIANEGIDMDHCVAGYAGHSSQGYYLVYSITDREGQRSTLGVRTLGAIQSIFDTGDNPSRRLTGYVRAYGGSTSKNFFYKDQHYGKHNSHVTQETKLFGEYVVKLINDQFEENLEFKVAAEDGAYRRLMNKEYLGRSYTQLERVNRRSEPFQPAEEFTEYLNKHPNLRVDWKAASRILRQLEVVHTTAMG